MDNKDILDIELSEEDASKLAEEIQAWKESYSAKLEEEAEEKIQAKLDELEEQNNAWREEVAEAYSEKFLAALDEMREDVRAEVLAESVETDPTHKVMEEVMRLVAPLMNEEYVENTYMGEIKRLADKVAEYERKEALNEGAATLEELIEGYDDAFKPALRAIIGEGTAEEVTAKFEAIVESLNEADEADDDEDDDDEDFDFDDEEEKDDEDEKKDKKSKKAKKSKKSKKDDEDDEDDEEEKDDEDDDEFDEDFDFDEVSTIKEDFEDDQDGRVKKNPLRESMMKLYK
jgi:hypothetical protein